MSDLRAGMNPGTLEVMVGGTLAPGPEYFGWFRTALIPDSPKIVETDVEPSRQPPIGIIAKLQTTASARPCTQACRLANALCGLHSK